MSVPSFQTFYSLEYSEQVQLLASEVFWMSLPTDCIAELIPHVFYESIREIQPNQEWLFGTYLRAFASRRNLTFPWEFNTECSKVVGSWKKELCSKFLKTWCKRDLIDLAEFLGLFGPLPWKDRLREFIRIIFVALVRAFVLISETTEFTADLVVLGVHQILDGYSRFGRDAFFFIGKKQIHLTMIKLVGTSSAFVKSVLRILGVGVFYSFKFTLQELHWVLTITIQKGYQITEAMFQWLSENASADHFRQLCEILGLALTSGMEAIVEVLVDLWNKFVFYLNQTLNAGENCLQKFKQAAATLRRCVETISSSILVETTSILQKVTWIVKEKAVGLSVKMFDLSSLAVQLTFFSAKQLWFLMRLVVQKAYSVSWFVEHLFETGLLRTVGLVCDRKFWVGIVKYLFQLGRVATWTVGVGANVSFQVGKRAMNFGKYVALSEDELAVIVRYLTKTSVLSWLVMKSICHVPDLVNNALEFVRFQNGDIRPHVMRLLAGATTVVASYSIFKLIQFCVPFLKVINKKAVCSFQQLFWYCVDVVQWNVETQKYFEREMRQIINTITKQNPAVQQKIELELNSVLEDRKLFEFDNDDNELMERKKRQFDKGSNDEENKNSIKEYWYSDNDIANLKKIPFIVPSIVKKIAAFLKVCNPSINIEEPIKCFEEMQFDILERRAAIQTCIQHLKNQGIKTKKDWRDWVKKNHPDKNVNYAKIDDVYKIIQTCGTNSKTKGVVFKDEYSSLNSKE